MFSLFRLILDELEEPVISQLYGQEWETGQKLAATIVATIDDYFNDVQVWLPDFFYSKFVRYYHIILFFGLNEKFNAFFHHKSQGYVRQSSH
jgi:hypothetical protein